MQKVSYSQKPLSRSCRQGPPEESRLSDLMKILQSIRLKMDSYNDNTDVSSHEYPPPRGKGTIQSQHG